MRNMASMIKKMQEMQGRLAVMQGEFASKEFTAIVGGGAVIATVNGDGKLTELKLSPNVLDRTDTGTLENMICLATNNALQQATDEKTKIMTDITGGLPLPPSLNLLL